MRKTMTETANTVYPMKAAGDSQGKYRTWRWVAGCVCEKANDQAGVWPVSGKRV
jgi:hypothetical protein